jgi:hypothetical protein
VPTICAQPVFRPFLELLTGWLRNMTDARLGRSVARWLCLAFAGLSLSGCMVVSWRDRVQPPPDEAQSRTAATRQEEARLDAPCAYATALRVSMLVTVPVVNRRIGQCQISEAVVIHADSLPQS